MKFGYQTVRWGWGRVANIFPQVLDEISEAGFAAIEANDVDVVPFLGDGRKFSEMLSERGIKLVGLDIFSLDSLLLGPLSRYASFHRIKKFMKFAASVECEKFVLGGPVSAVAREEVSEKIYAKLSKAWNRIGKECVDLHLEASFHPVVESIGTTPAQLNKLLELTDPDLINLTVDTGHLAIAGINPLEVIKNYPDRIVHVHLKDVKGGIFAELGEGTDINIPEVMKSLRLVGYDDWVIVEDEVIDNAPPLSILGRTTRLPLETAKRSKKYIENLMKSDFMTKNPKDA